MAKLKTGRHTGAMKEARKNIKRRKANRELKEKVKKEIKKFKKAISAKDSSAGKILSSVQGLLDRAGKRKVFHKNKANRLKSRMSVLQP
ncbi:MAG: 30S ribosomal protein S20 [Elusimicrobia bacterium CG08_land_8_20_14_0_20_44_26]|nr:MAG: 30S ribosomal protein S20 [Elusimicrobia bacterium CG08_land_8_20_14_0_20_44_26]